MPKDQKGKGKGKGKGPYDKGDPEGEDPRKYCYLCPFTPPIILLLDAIPSEEIAIDH